MSPLDTVLRYTDAPRAFDLDGTDTYGPGRGISGTDTAGKEWRAVAIPRGRLDEQGDRYRAGCYATMPARDWNAAIKAGAIRRTPISHTHTARDGFRVETLFTDDPRAAKDARRSGVARGATFARVFRDGILATYRVACHFGGAS